MSFHTIRPGLFSISLGFVNVFLLKVPAGLLLIDTGMPGSAGRILAAVEQAGYRLEDIRNILLTHLHVDHSGGLAELKRRTGAQAWAHPEDAALIRNGRAGRTSIPGPGLVKRLVYTVMMLTGNVSRASVEPAEIEHEIDGRDRLPPELGGGQVIYAPGHTRGHICLWLPEGGGAVIAGDAAGNLAGLGYSMIYEDLPQGIRTLQRLSGLDFDAACFGHGPAITREADRAFRRKWPAPD